MNTRENVVSFEDIKQDGIQRRLLFRKLQPRIKDKTVKHLKKVMQGMFDNADDALFKLAESAPEGIDKNLYFDSMRVVRLQRDSIERTFFSEIEQHFTNFEEELDNETSQTSLADIDSDSMELVSEADLEINLAIRNLVQKILNLYSQDLSELDKRLAYLANCKDKNDIVVPFGAEAIVHSFVRAAEQIDLVLEIQLIIVKLFDLHCIHNLAELYSSLNQMLIDENVLPVIKSEIIKMPSPQMSVPNPEQLEGMAELGNDMPAGANVMGIPGVTGMPAGVGMAGVPGMAGISAGQMSTPAWAQLQQLVSSQRQNLANENGSVVPFGQGPAGMIGTPGVPGVAGAAGMPVGGVGGVGQAGGFGSFGGGVNLSTQDVVDTLTTIQSTNFDEVPDGGAYAVGNFLRVQLQQANEQGGQEKVIDPLDNDVINIVCLLFEYILDDPNLPMTAKASIGRLQIPMLKVAMLDKEFFSMNGHPARYLLNLLASTAVGVDESDGLEQPILNKINEIVEEVLEKFTDDLSLFTELTEQLNEFISEQQLVELQACKDISQVQHEKEEMVLAKTWVKETLSQHLIGRELPKPVVDIILGPWKEVMLETYLQEGEYSQLWKTQIRFIDVLCWSVEPKVHNLDRKKLGAIIQQLVVTLRDGFELIDMPQEDLNKILSTLEPYHLASVHGLNLSDCIMEENANESIESIKAVLSDEKDIDSLDEEIDNIMNEEKVMVEEIVLEDWEPTNELDQINDEYLELARHLDMGKWVEFKDENGETRRAKLAWKSELLGEFTFLNWKFDVVADKTLLELAEDLRQGNAKVVDDVPLMDRALSAVVSGLIPKAS